MTNREDILKRIKGDNLVMSSVPSKTKEEFIQFAKDEFADNYGACLKYVFDFFKLSVTFLEGFDGKLDTIIKKLDENGEQEEKTGIKMLSGKKLKGGKSEE